MAYLRRDFLKLGLLAGGGLVLDISLPSLAGHADANSDAFAPNAFIQIATDNAITLIMPNTEFGQGIWTAASMLLADELDVGLDQIRVVPAPPDEAKYADPLLGEQATGGSTSVRGDWDRLRQAGAAARAMLVAAAAKQWKVDPASCRASRSIVYHDPSHKSATYGQLADAAARLDRPANPPLKKASEWRLIGTSQKRLDTPDKVNGKAVFGIDVQVPGMKVGTVAACPVPGGKLKSIDEAAARKVPGVRDVVRLDNAVAVIGDHMWSATQGLIAADPQWDEGPNATLSTEAIVKALDDASHANGLVAKDEGGAAKQIDAATTKLTAVYQLPFLSHAPMEPINTTIHVRPDGADLWVGTQVPVRAQLAVAKATGLAPEKVIVHNHLMGGAFGRRLDVDSIEQSALIARQLQYPVKLVWTREEDITHDMFRPYYYDRVAAGLDANGKIVGWTHRVTGSSVMARWAPSGLLKNGLDPDAVEAAAETPYDLPSMLVDYVRHEPPGIQTAWWRGVGPTHNVFVVESFIDECAAAARTDPVEFRRRLLQKNPRALAVLNLAAEKAGWGGKLPNGAGRGVCLQFAFGSYLAHILEIQVAPRDQIRLLRSIVAIDCGQRVNPDTVAAQIEGGVIFGLSMAMYSEITHLNGRVQQSNFNDYRVLRINEAPKVEVYQVDNREQPGGIGETGTAASAAALGNAIFAATGRRLRKIPFATGALASS